MINNVLPGINIAHAKLSVAFINGLTIRGIALSDRYKWWMYIAVHSSGKIQYMPALSVCAGFLAQKGVWNASRQCILKYNAG